MIFRNTSYIFLIERLNLIFVTHLTLFTFFISYWFFITHLTLFWQIYFLWLSVTHCTQNWENPGKLIFHNTSWIKLSKYLAKILQHCYNTSLILLHRLSRVYFVTHYDKSILKYTFWIIRNKSHTKSCLLHFAVIL